MEKETILVVDDNHELTELLTMLLASTYHVICAYDGYQGMERAQTHKPDLILLDMNMPRMTGIEMLEALRDTDCHAPVIFMTAKGSEYIAVQAFKLGVQDYLSKPFSRVRLEETLDRALHEMRLTREKEQMEKRLAAAEAVRQTVATLAHHINNQLMVIHGGLALLQENAEWTVKQAGIATPDTIIADSQRSVFHISAVLRVLQRVAKVELTTYHDNTHMVDIDEALEKELRVQHL